MPTSILDSVKQPIGIITSDTSFDVDLIIHINTVFMILNQLGIGPANGFSISSNAQNWETYLAAESNVEGVKTYMILRVKALFDPAVTSFTQESFKKICDELEWRLIVQKESQAPPIP